MALFRKFFYRKPPDGLLEISERVYVFDCCFTTEVLEEEEYKVYIAGIVGQLRESLTDASFMVFNFREGESQSLVTNILSEYDMTVIDYPRHYEGCPLLTMEMIHHFLRSSESWLSLGQQNVLLMHCERGGWPVLAFMLAGLLIYRKQYAGEQKILDMIYKQAPQELLQLMSPLNPLPSQLRYLQYVSRRNVASEWPPLDRALTLDCVIIRCIPNMDGEGGCRPIFRIYGQDPFMATDRTSKVLFSTPKKSKLVRQYKQVDCELVKIDIHCHIQGDVVLECISLDNDLEREEMMFRVMFNTAFIRSNILMLNPDDIDILWHAKDQFPKDFRAEVLFSEMEATTSLISVELPNIEEKDGLPIEAFARVQEIFSNVDWLSPKGDAALNVLQKITASNLLQEKLVSSGSLERNQLLDLSFEKLISESETSEDNIRSLRWKLQTNQPLPSSEPPQSKIITQLIPQPSLSTPVSFRSSVQGSPPPLLRYHSAPSALGITALLHDHSEFSSKEVIHPATISSPSSALLTTSVLDSRKDIQPGKLPILPLLLPLEPSATLENSPTTTSTSTIPDPLSLHQLSLKPIKSSISQPSQTTSRGRSQLSPSSLQPTCTSFPVEPSPSFNESLPSISSSSPLLRPSPSFSSKESFFVPTSPPLRARFSRLESPSFSRWTNGSISPSTPQPSSTTLLLSSTKTSGSISPSPPQPSSTTLLLSSTKTSTQSFSSDDRLVSSKSPKKNLTIVPPQSFSSDDRLVSSKSSKKHKSSKKNLTIVPPQSFSSDDRLVSSKSPKKNLTIVPPQSFYSDDRLVYSKSSKKNLTIVPPQSFSSDDRLVSSKSPKKNLTIVPPQSFSSEDRLVSSKSYKKNLTIVPPQSFSQSFSSDDRLVSSKSSKKNLTIVPPQSFSSDDRLVSSKSPKKNLSIVPPQSFSSDDRLVSSKSPKKNLTIVPPPPPCSSPNLGASVVSPTLASPPPPPPPSWKDSTITTMHDPPPPPPPPAPPLPPSNLSSPSTSGSSVTSLGPPPPPPPPPSPPPLGLAPHDSATIVRNLTVVPGPPPPPPPPSLSSSLGPSIVSLVPPPPPPPPSLAANVSATTMHVSGPPPPPPPPFANSGSTLCRGDVTSAPPAPPPPGFSMNGSTTHAPPAPPPPGLSGNKLSNVNGTNSQSHVGINNSNIPSIPGPPSSALFAKGRGLGRLNPKSMSQPKRSNLKPYHWLKLTRAMQGSLWAETQKTDEASKAPEFDMSELESLFSAATPNSDSGGSGNARRASGPKSDKVQLIELRRAYNCEIMLSKVKIPLPDMMCSVLALDDSALDVDQVENLIKFCPTKEEIELLKGYSGDKDNLGKCEQFFLELLKVPRVESKLRVFSFKIQFRSQASDLRNSLNTINSASDEIRNSTKLKRVMQTILSLGNALNHGTARGSAIGFRLDSLLKLTDTRARNNKMTLMHYLCKVLGEKLPELLDFPKDLLSLEGSTKIQLKYLAEEMQAISKGLEKVVQELANSENDGPVSECFCRTLKDFLSHAEAEVRSLASLYSNVGRNADALALYFGEDPARCPFEQVVSTLFNFVRMFVRAHEENCKQLEYERKKALKEAAEKEKEKQKERLKVSTPEKESGFFMRTKT